MAYTSHGHLIPGTASIDPPPYVGHCFGAAGCPICKREIKDWNDSQLALNQIDVVENLSMDFQHQAMQIVREYVNVEQPGVEFDVYVVWFSKTLQNWKALVATTRADDMYYEVTYDGDKKQAYLDAYMKVHNRVIKD